MEYRFKINIDADKKVEDISETTKTYVKGQRSMVLVRYSRFTEGNNTVRYLRIDTVETL